jgi:signal transduction histidine kinase
MTIAERAAEARAWSPPEKNPVKVLLVEDDATDRALVEDLLHSDGAFEVASYPSLAPALQCLKTRRFDAAVIDMILPDAEGMEIYSRLMEAAPDLPVIVLTGTTDTYRFDALLKAGAQDCLVKLHPLGQLLPRAIRYAIERHRIKAELARRLRDVTALREAEARQAEIQEQLRHAQKIDALGTLAGGIAHDLNNTLLPIRTLAPVLRRAAGRSDQELRSLDLIMAAAQRASHLVQQILAFSRKQEVARQPLQLDALVRDSLTMLRAGISPQVRIDTDLAATPAILGNPGQLYQVLLNLVLNAAQAIGERPGVIAIAVAPDKGGARLSVTDDGCGMDEETQRRIFEPFFTTRAASDGTGLGLSVVKGIVTEHHGGIAVVSKPGGGTRFDVVFAQWEPDDGAHPDH